jgi:hypothetical protein
MGAICVFSCENLRLRSVRNSWKSGVTSFSNVIASNAYSGFLFGCSPKLQSAKRSITEEEIDLLIRLLNQIYDNSSDNEQ